MSDEVFLWAKAYVDAGLSVIPIAADGTKRPKASVLPLSDEQKATWQPFTTRLAADEELRQWFNNGDAGIAIIGGTVSGNLERIDFDCPGIYDEWRELCESCGFADLEASLTLVRTPRDPNCYHVYYRCEVPIENNQPLARRQIEEDGKTSIKTIVETRGEAGYTIAPGSPAACHETGREYEIVRGDLCALPIITAEQRECLLELARSFNEYIPDTSTKGRTDTPGSADRPGDDYNNRGDWRRLITDLGWTHVSTRGDTEYYCRPGKKQGISASWNHRGGGIFYPFSSNAFPFEPMTSYTPFGIYALIEHQGDYAAAARALGAQGYGQQRPAPSTDPEPYDDDAPPPTDTDAPDSFDAGTPPDTTGDPHVTRPLSDLGNSERLIDLYGRDIQYVVDWKKWIIWDGVRWKVDNDFSIHRLALKAVRTIYQEAAKSETPKKYAMWALASESQARLSAMVQLAQYQCPKQSSELDADPHLLCCLNGVVDLQRGGLLTPMRENFITKQVAITYDATATAPIWEKFMESVQPDVDARLYLQSAAGYSLTGDVSEQCLFFLYGEGKNGKTTFIETLSILVGEYFTKTGSDSLMVKRFGGGGGHEVAALKAARLVTVSEISDGQQLDEGLVKDMTGGDTMTARHLYGDPFNFKAGFKLWLYGNVKPKIKGKDEGIWRRVRLVPFTIVIPPAQRDPHLAEKFKGELAGILNWAIEGCMIWQLSGLKEPDCILAATDEYRAEQDTLASFIGEHCTLGKDRTCKVSKKILWAVYQKYVVESGEPGYEHKPTFFKEIMRIPGVKSARGTDNVSEFRGISVTADPNTDPEPTDGEFSEMFPEESGQI
jgi:putative DNA primase/helicase